MGTKLTVGAGAGADDLNIVITYVSMEEIDAKNLVDRFKRAIEDETYAEFGVEGRHDASILSALIDIDEKILLLVRLGQSIRFNAVTDHLFSEIEYLKKIRNKIINLK